MKPLRVKSEVSQSFVVVQHRKPSCKYFALIDELKIDYFSFFLEAGSVLMLQERFMKCLGCLLPESHLENNRMHLAPVYKSHLFVFISFHK